MHFVPGEKGIPLSGILLTVPVGIVILAVGLLFCLWAAWEEDE